MKLIDYVKDVKGEMSHVNWPKRDQAILFTVLVVVISVVVASYLGLLDSAFKIGVEKILGI